MDLQEQYTGLLRYCYMKTGDRYLAEDIVQETFLRFWQSHTYRETGRQSAYLYAIARNLCMDAFRSGTTLSLDENPELGEPVDADMDSALRSIAIEQALAQLPEDLRELVTMRYISDMSAADIGKVVGLSRFAVARRVKEGLQLLKQYMEGENEP